MITIHGASDDLIEIGGDIEEEFSAEDEGYLFFSDGTLFKISYQSGGFWRINLFKEGTAKFSKVEGRDSENDYSDKATLDGDIKWVGHGSQWTPA